MISKSAIRQSALAAIYAVMENGGSSGTMDWELFWTIAEERASQKLCLSIAKAIEHQCRANEDSASQFATRAEAAFLSMEGDLTTASLREGLDRYVRCNNEFNAALDTLHYSVKNKKRVSPEQIAGDSADVLRLASVLINTAGELTPCFADFPAYRSVLDPLKAAIRRRSEIMQACVLLKDPAALADNMEFKGLARLAQDLKNLRPAAQKLADDVLMHREQLESRLVPLLQNYSVDRLDTVDKCILYLALYELEIGKLETPIVVAEATALAHVYSGGKSAPFIHGIIAAAAKA